jgi:DNA polymerase-1
MPTLHPAGVMRSGFTTLPALAADLHRVQRALKGQLRPYRSAYQTAPHTTTGPVVAYDIETSRSRESNRVIERIGLADPELTWTAPWGAEVKRCVAAALQEPGRVKVAHNMAYDLPRIQQTGIEVAPPLWDTMLAASLLQPDLYKGLNAVASLYLDRPRWKHESEDRPAYYNAQDASATLELYTALRDGLDETGQVELFEQVMMPTVPVLIRMSERGIRMNEEARGSWLYSLAMEEQQAARWWTDVVPDIAPTQDVRIARKLYGEWGLPDHSKGSVDEPAIKKLIAISEGEKAAALTALLSYRKARKLRTTYAARVVGEDGCVHPSYLPATKDDDTVDEDGSRVRRKGLAGTGRITAHNPNIQNQPNSARRMYIPHRDGMTLVECDYSQIEMRVMASLSGDKVLLAALEGDLHARTMELLGCDRTRAKNFTYALAYGGGARTITAVLNNKGSKTTEAEVKRYMAAYAAGYKGFWEWRQHVVRCVETDYYLRNPFGRRRYFYQGGKDAPAALDFIPQSTAADIMWSVLAPLECAVAAVGGSLLATVHDSVLGEFPRGAVGRGMKAMQEVMQQTFDCVAPGFWVPVAAKVGENWGEMLAVEG